MINWQFFPKSDKLPLHLSDIVKVFNDNENAIKSPQNELSSDEVLNILYDGLLKVGLDVEKSKKATDKIKVPVLFGRNGKLEKSFEADAVNKETGTVLEVEAGRALTNYQFLKDLFQACMMHDIHYLAIAVRNKYRNSPDFEKIVSFFETLYASGRLTLPLKGIIVIGY